MTIDARLFQTSGLNSQFNGGGLSFDDYLKQTQAMIKEVRLDTGEFPDSVTANSPFEWRPNRFERKRGILLVHGLFDSPFMMRDVARHFLNRGFLVRSILLPGHGTIPGDLLHIQRAEWRKAVEYGVEQIKQVVDEVYIGGYSLGGALAINHALHDSSIRGLILFCPALELANPNLAAIFQAHVLISWLVKRADWFQKNPPIDFAKYTSYALAGVDQVYLLTKETKTATQNHTLSTPLFIAQSANDEVLCSNEVINFFKAQSNPLNQMIYYSATPIELDDARIQQCTSAYPEDNIVNMSHICVAIAPENPHYGVNGDFKDFLHYPNNTPPAGKIYLGARTKDNLNNHIIQRITFNPDFAGMMREVDGFLQTI